MLTLKRVDQGERERSRGESAGKMEGGGGMGGMLPLRDMFRAQGKMMYAYNDKIIGT